MEDVVACSAQIHTTFVVPVVLLAVIFVLGFKTIECRFMLCRLKHMKFQSTLQLNQASSLLPSLLLGDVILELCVTDLANNFL